MPPTRRVLFKRGTAAQNNVYLGSSGEVTIDVTNKSIRIHDGVTLGGVRTISHTELTSQFTTHASSTDHDARYYIKSEIDDFFAGLAAEGFDPQNTPLLIDALNFGWRDLTTEIKVKGTGNNNPSWIQFREGIYAHGFEAGKMMECWANFHVDHDYALGTKLYPHVHWSPKSTLGGTVRWGFEFTVAKGHGQGATSVFGPTSIVYVTHDLTTGGHQYEHMVTEVSEIQAVPATLVEPDTLIMMRVFRDGANDTHADTVAGFTVDLHYQTERIATLNKAPDFFTSP